VISVIGRPHHCSMREYVMRLSFLLFCGFVDFAFLASFFSASKLIELRNHIHDGLTRCTHVSLKCTVTIESVGSFDLVLKIQSLHTLEQIGFFLSFPPPKMSLFPFNTIQYDNEDNLVVYQRHTTLSKTSFSVLGLLLTSYLYTGTKT
jgi:hypothetical protein